MFFNYTLNDIKNAQIDVDRLINHQNMDNKKEIICTKKILYSYCICFLDYKKSRITFAHWIDR